MKKKIYVADDDPAIVEIMTLVLEDGGYDVEVSFDGKSITEKKNDFPDLIFLDIRMSGTNGGDICKAIKNSEMKNIPVILVSANRDIKEITKQSNADDYLEKPFDIAELVKLADNYLKC